MSSHALEVVIVTLLAALTGLVGFILYRQFRLIAQMTQLLASRTLGEWASAQKMIERPKKEPVAEGGNW